MLKDYHIEICQRALRSFFSARALNVLVTANVGQDQIRYQVRHPHFHFDSNTFEAGYAYIAAQRQMAREMLKSGGREELAWQAFGRLTHTAQDFYAHSNYARLWLAAQPAGEPPAPSQIDALAPEILQHPDLHSGKIYFWDWVAFLPGCYALGLRLTPKDSHTHMNLDHPGRGPLFPYAREAAIKRTLFEFRKTIEELSVTERARFSDQ